MLITREFATSTGGKRGPSTGVRISAKRQKSPLILSPEEVILVRLGAPPACDPVSRQGHENSRSVIPKNQGSGLPPGLNEIPFQLV